ncbi:MULTISPECIES: EF-P lysine aminoacylase EpmA [Ectothiorhodospira]|jgi:lysyl-tRNA synthetase class 2|uniref:Lysyl-tRNA synthetase, class 2 n=1 Tax=Ectothiorhodospira marina TaxID=1396821 RepID=A0A1H7ND76_9GAMM|nr:MULTISPECIES: EF-P lysine aminoacylase EpmA [Ectothiorhodospira]MCG5515812.1 EF-P lysine aminoacylase GenX [Ectothiorhodospira sp. 9100]MCG5518898.1 EF-P lysine aminoacylase GenX [Ectothiorhodospira sp. 9905]SEL20925.1 lysyl-tRNA synthetase, class 2 [Ectothiorhodospira marina]
MTWAPAAALERLRQRARLLADIRAFFACRGVLEVETPYLSTAGATDPAIQSLSVPMGGGRRWLHSSPEFPMKRLLAAGSGDIYQIARVFRGEEAGRRHNPEFTLLEWYRVGFDHHALMAEVEALIRQVAGDRLAAPAQVLTYREAMLRHAGVDPFQAGEMELSRRARSLGLDVQGSLDRDGWLDLLMSMVVCEAFPANTLTLVHDYPASQAALARVRPGEPPLAERFEVYWGAMELANGFHELGDAAEQRRRFQADRDRRAQQGLSPVPLDERLIEALEAGLPDCAGVALGVDRLAMCLFGVETLRDVLAFDWERA